VDSGTEAIVYFDPDDKTKVIKTVKYLGQTKSLPEFFERTTGFNALFPETAYDIVGFIEKKVVKMAYGRDKMLQPVLKQFKVMGTLLSRLDNPEKEFEKFLQQFKNLGYEVDFDEETITKNGYEASDLNWRNIIKFENQYYVIDAWVRKITQNTKSTIRKAETSSQNPAIIDSSTKTQSAGYLLKEGVNPGVVVFFHGDLLWENEILDVGFGAKFSLFIY
jgi:hypothetical protein